MGVVTCDFYILDNTLAHDPVAGVLLRIFDVTGTTLVTTGTTDALGHLAKDLDGTYPTATRYQVRCSKIGTSFENPEYAEVYDPLPPDTANSFNIYGDIHTLQPAVNPLMCRATGLFVDPGGRPIQDLMIKFSNEFNPINLDGVGIAGKLEVRTDANGWAVAELPRGGKYWATVSGLHDENLEIIVPDRASVNLIDLLWPVVAQVVFDPAPPWTVLVGNALHILTQVITSAYTELLGPAYGDITYTVRDSGIVTLSFADDGIYLVGQGSGTTYVDLTRADDTIHRIPDAPIVGSGGQISVA
jgi:hypothetical protein